MRILMMAGCAALIGLITMSGAKAQDPWRAIATLTTSDGKAAGVAELTELEAGVLVTVQLYGLTPGEHAVHIHESGACMPDFAAAGGHFEPGSKGHGFASENGPHAGDLPNIYVGVDGGAVADFLNQRITLSKGPDSLFDDDGAAMIVHRNADTYGQDAAAGPRVACGVINPQF